MTFFEGKGRERKKYGGMVTTGQVILNDTIFDIKVPLIE